MYNYIHLKTGLMYVNYFTDEMMSLLSQNRHTSLSTQNPSAINNKGIP